MSGDFPLDFKLSFLASALSIDHVLGQTLSVIT